jgi:hypothetical protein
LKPHVFAVPQVASALAGVPLHGAHAEPQFAGCVSSTQLPEQSCLPGSQWPSHDIPIAMHLPLQMNVPVGHLVPHWVPSQVASPPSGFGQTRQALVQAAGSASPTH